MLLKIWRVIGLMQNTHLTMSRTAVSIMAIGTEWNKLCSTILPFRGMTFISPIKASHTISFPKRTTWHVAMRSTRLNPQALLIYGNKMLVSGVKAYYFANENLIRLRHGKK